jgi:dihydrofolate reductase
MIKLIVVMDRNRIIWNNGALSWYFSKDLKFFKESTVWQVVLMGRKIFEFIGKSLPNRVNIVVSSSLKPESNDGLHIVENVENVLELCADRYPDQIIWIIGGSSIYVQAIVMDIVDEVYCTEIDGEFDGDVKMLEFEDRYVLQSSVETEDVNKFTGKNYKLSLLKYVRKQ